MSNLHLDGKSILLEQMVSDYCDYIDMGFSYFPKESVYRIVSSEEGGKVDRQARKATIKSFNKPIIKTAFDTRKINQETTRIPRANLQYWHRAEPFISKEDEEMLNKTAHLMNILDEIKNEYGTEPEWFESYARVLYDSVYRILKIGQEDTDVFKPQLSYLEQLLDVRYRLSMNDIVSKPKNIIKDSIMSKDERLLKRGNYLRQAGLFKNNNETKKVVSEPKKETIVVDGNGATTQQSIIEALFGNTSLRRDGERTVERTITITLKDNVIA